MTQNLYKILFSILSLLALSACDPAEDEAKRLGFNDLTDMRATQAKGWHTKNQYYADNFKSSGFSSIEEMKQAEYKGIEERKQAEIDAKNHVTVGKKMTQSEIDALNKKAQSSQKVVQTASQYTMLVVCVPPMGRLAETAIQVAKNADPIQFAYAMQSGGFATYCSSVNKSVSNQSWMQSMQEVGRDGNSIYWYAEMPNGNSFTGIGLVSR